MPCNPYVLDASAIIQIKADVPAPRQWDVLKRIEELVAQGTVCFPREVAREVKKDAHPDAPGVWVHGVEREIRHPLDPTDRSMQYVMRMAGAVVDLDREVNGDAQVLALAHELREDGHQATVVSEDFADRDKKLSVESACGLIGIPHIRLVAFLSAVAGDLMR